MLNEKARAALKEELLNSYLYKENGISEEALDMECEKKYRGLIARVPKRYQHIKEKDIPASMEFPLPEDKNGIYLWGGVGAGKTSALYALKDRSAIRGQKFHIANMTELLHRIKASFNTDDKEDIVNECQYYFAFDDLGVEKDTEWAAEQVYRMINFIYENERTFFITSNYSLKELAGRYGDYGDRIASRIAEMAQVIELKGVDRRV